MQNIVIGLEGLVGSGKTSICRELLNIIPNSIVFHGGNLYRGIVYALIKNSEGISFEELKNNTKNVDIKELMDKLQVEFKVENNETVVYIKGEKIDEEKLQSESSSMAVSIAGGSADNSKLFIFCRDFINKCKEKYNVILSGRSLMEIYPELDYHFFIVADIDERVKRKAIQYGNDVDILELKNHIELRDKLQEEAGFYKIYPNTIEIDVTDCKNVRESTEKLCNYINELKVTM